MKKFEFPLARVLDWRQTQARIEESKLQRLHAEARMLESQLTETRGALEASQRELILARSVTGMELLALDDYKKASAAECAKLAESVAAARKRVAEQLKVVIQKRSDVKLLDNLRSRRLEAWRLDLGKEIEREAGELYLARKGRAGALDV